MTEKPIAVTKDQEEEAGGFLGEEQEQYLPPRDHTGRYLLVSMMPSPRLVTAAKVHCAVTLQVELVKRKKSQKGQSVASRLREILRMDKGGVVEDENRRITGSSYKEQVLQ